MPLNAEERYRQQMYKNQQQEDEAEVLLFARAFCDVSAEE